MKRSYSDVGTSGLGTLVTLLAVAGLVVGFFLGSLSAPEAPVMSNAAPAHGRP